MSVIIIQYNISHKFPQEDKSRDGIAIGIEEYQVSYWGEEEFREEGRIKKALGI